MKKNKQTKLWILAAVAVCGFAGSAMATPVGILNTANCGGGGVDVTATTITWLPAAGAGVGCITTGLGTNVSYTGGTLGAGVNGQIKNLTVGGGAVDLFMSFTGTPLDFVLTGLGPGSSTICSGAVGLNQTCSATATSPFVLTNLGANTGVSLTAFGTANDGGGGSANWTGAFTTQLSGLTLTQVLTILGNGGTIESTHSASFTVSAASVPEPATLSMMGLGLLGLGLIGRRKRKV
jgi:PEP-CTERM motif